MQETWVRSLGREHLEKGKVIYSSILAWRISWTEEPGRLLEKGKVIYSSILAWRITGTEESGRLQSMGL